jgi:hypothetical protein
LYIGGERLMRVVNAFLCSAKIIEARLEVDAKFSKLADKECEAVTSDIRKWFKKLSKEEKAHDDRVVSANAKIKSASKRCLIRGGLC